MTWTYNNADDLAYDGHWEGGAAEEDSVRITLCWVARVYVLVERSGQEGKREEDA